MSGRAACGIAWRYRAAQLHSGYWSQRGVT